MVMRVATFALNDQMMTAALRTQARMAQLQLQETSGVVSTDFGGLGASSKRVIDLQVSVTRAQSYIDGANGANGKVQVMYSALGSMTDALTNLRSLLAGATDGANTNGTSVKESAQEMLQEFASLLNTRYGDGYVF